MFEVIKRVIRSRKPKKDRQHNGHVVNIKNVYKIF